MYKEQHMNNSADELHSNAEMSSIDTPPRITFDCNSCKSKHIEQKCCSRLSNLYSRVTYTVNYFDTIKWLIHLTQKWKEDRLVREVRRAVPDGILPMGITGTLIDVSVKPKAGVGDDAVFKNNQELRNYMTRGMTLMQLKHQNTFEEKSDFVIYANKKFFEADDIRLQDADQQNFLAYKNNLSRIVAVEKINGEAGHFSGRIINGEFYLIAGSKNVHLIFQNEDHIEKYTEDRYSIARLVAHSVLKIWQNMSDETRLFFHSFLNATKTSIICEIKLPLRQHVVHFKNMFDNELIILGTIEPPIENSESLTAIPSDCTFELFSNLGFKTPDFEIITESELQEHVYKTRQASDTEGTVYYYEDADGNTFFNGETKVYLVHSTKSPPGAGGLPTRPKEGPFQGTGALQGQV